MNQSINIFKSYNVGTFGRGEGREKTMWKKKRLGGNNERSG